ncbi:alpha/beta hydrolase [Phaeacidiphilus oryzae]|uniref:alpha/beta hydrolase n=1 Tax=Phaeacidiphilus oryzae TaxID=348818 RepID=UPI0005648023|nr:alpha/beta hydrolase [Phaeacidiphilus oryzae]
MRLKRTLIAAVVSLAVLCGSGAAAAGAAVSDEQVAITGPLPGTTAWHRDHALDRSLPDPQSAEPADTAAFFASLSDAQQEQLAQRYPLVVGNLDGAPVQLRYRANRIALQQAVADPRTSAALAGEYRALLRPGRQILAFDPRSRGQVAEVFGDLTAAQRISVLVPGSDVDATHYEDTQQPPRAAAGMAQSLYAQEQADSPGTRTAVIAWADYTTPVGLGADAATSRLAEAAVPRLDHLLAGLRATTHPLTAPSLFCHSYGSVVCGLAAPGIRRSHGVTDMVVFGSPGMGVPDAAKLGDGVRLWATRNGSDWISNVPYLEVEGLGHGADPTSAGFGSRVVSAAGAHGHTGYLYPGTDSLRSFADIALGRYSDVVCATGDPSCDRGL